MEKATSEGAKDEAQRSRAACAGQPGGLTALPPGRAAPPSAPGPGSAAPDREVNGRRFRCAAAPPEPRGSAWARPDGDGGAEPDADAAGGGHGVQRGRGGVVPGGGLAQHPGLRHLPPAPARPGEPARPAPGVPLPPGRRSHRVSRGSRGRCPPAGPSPVQPRLPQPVGPPVRVGGSEGPAAALTPQGKHLESGSPRPAPAGGHGTIGWGEV